MKTKQHIIFTLISVLSMAPANAQDTSRQRRGLSDLYIQNGIIVSRSMTVDINDFRQLAPGSEILKNNFNGYSPYNNYDVIYNDHNVDAGFAFTALLAKDLCNRRTGISNPNRQLRIGVTYISQTGFSNTLRKESHHIYDTVSTPQGNLYYDSVETKTLHMKYGSEQLRLDVSFIFKTDANARWSLYGGIGLSTGMSLNSFIQIDQQTSNYIQTRGALIGFGYLNQGSYNSQVETFRMKSNYGVTAYVPLGVDFRMGRKKPFWKRLHLYMEMRPGVSMLTVQGLPSFTTGQMHNAFGLRVRL
jgi:hypothetical protein